MIKNFFLKLLGRKPIKVVIAKTGYFHLSVAAFERLIELGCSVHKCTATSGPLIKGNPDIIQFQTKDVLEEADRFSLRLHFSRSDSRLLQVIAELGEKAAVASCKLKIITLPLDVTKFYVYEGDCGNRESICEAHRTFF